MSTYTVCSSNGELKCDRNGVVVECACYQGGDEYIHRITKIDLDEYKATYGSIPIYNEFDILDIGYWTADGIYEPPCQDHRDNIKLAKADV